MPRRSALITVLVTAAIAWGSLALVLATGTTPKLGLDLQGGFAVVLEAPEGTDAGVLEKAVEVMTRRIEALGGVQEPILKVVDDRNIQVELPGVTDRDRARAAVGTTGQLEFRPVLARSPVIGVSLLVIEADQVRSLQESLDQETDTTTTTEAGADTTTTTITTVPAEPEPLDLTSVLPEGISLCDLEADLAGQPGCVDPVTGFTLNDDPLREAWMIDPENGQSYYLAPACSRQVWADGECDDPRINPDAPEGTPENALLGADLAGAETLFQSTGGGGPLGAGGAGIGEWIVRLDFNSSGGDKFTTITKELASFPDGSAERQFAIVLDGEVISAPQMAADITAEEGISGGTAIITLGNAEDPEREATDLAVVLRYGALPVSFVAWSTSSVSRSSDLSSLWPSGCSGLPAV